MVSKERGELVSQIFEGELDNVLRVFCLHFADFYLAQLERAQAAQGIDASEAKTPELRRYLALIERGHYDEAYLHFIDETSASGLRICGIYKYEHNHRRFKFQRIKTIKGVL